MVLFRKVHYKLSCGNKRLFIRKRDIFACTNCCKGGLQANIADYRGHNCIHILVCSRLDQTIHPAHYANFRIRKATLQCLCVLRVHHRNQFRVKFTRLFFQKRNIFIPRNGGNTDIT